jgi:hypothetical protein
MNITAMREFDTEIEYYDGQRMMKKGGSIESCKPNFNIHNPKDISVQPIFLSCCYIVRKPIYLFHDITIVSKAFQHRLKDS